MLTTGVTGVPSYPVSAKPCFPLQEPPLQQPACYKCVSIGLELGLVFETFALVFEKLRSEEIF